jgi:hypothetical protein
MLDLSKFTEEFVAAGGYLDKDETVKDDAVLDAIKQRKRESSSRNKAVVDWLHYYKVLMGFSGQERINVGDQILGHADERHGISLGLDKHLILSEFKKLEERINKVAPRTKAGAARDVTSLTSKGLWCCYPDDVPIYDRNAVTALGVISRILRIATEPAPSEYERFLDVWIRVYREVERVIKGADLSDCPQKVRVLDRMLWYLGDTGFYNNARGSLAAKGR